MPAHEHFAPSTHTTDQQTPEALVARESIKSKALADRTDLSQTIERQKTDTYAAHFVEHFGADNLSIAQQVLWSFQHTECLPHGEDVTTYPPAEVLPLIQTEVAQKIALAKSRHIEAKIDQENQYLDEAKTQAQKEKFKLSNTKTQLSEQEQKLTKTNTLTAERLANKGAKKIEQNTTLAEAKAENTTFNTLLNEKLSAIGEQDLNSLVSIEQQIREKGFFIGKDQQPVSLEPPTVATAILTRITDVRQTITHLQTHFRPSERALLAQAPINLAGSSTAEVYAGVFAAIESGIADESRKKELKQQVRKTLKLDVAAKTGSDIKKIFSEGAGTTVDGAVIPFTDQHPAKLNEHTTLFERADGTRVVDFSLPDNRHINIEFPANATSEAIGEAIFTGQMIYAAESLALAQPIFQRGIHITHGGTIDLHYDDVIKAKRVAQCLLGDTAGYDGTLLSNSDIQRLQHDFQAFRAEGDWATGDNDPARATRDFQALGIVDDAGSLNWGNFQKASEFIQRKNSQGVVPEFVAVQAYLQPSTTPSKAG